MGVTSTDLYRSGNAASSRLDQFRVPPGAFDIDTYTDSQGVVWVKANSGGVSTWEKPDVAWSKTWRLPGGSNFSSDLRVWSDAPGHWLWEPMVDMQIQRYRDALTQASNLFVRT